MVPFGTDWETFFSRIDGDQSQAKVLVVLLTKAFFRSIPCLKEVDAAIKKGGIYIIPTRVESEENYEVGERNVAR
jgi:hypothetical protein